MAKFAHNQIADLAKNGYKPRVVNGKIETKKVVPNDFIPAKTESIRDKVRENTNARGGQP